MYHPVGRMSPVSLAASSASRSTANLRTPPYDTYAPPEAAFTCDWLVGMSVKGSGELRVGCGRYDWRFRRGQPLLANALAITIEQMQVLPAQQADAVFAWLTGLSYPWTSAQAVLAAAPDIPALVPVLQHVGREAARC